MSHSLPLQDRPWPRRRLGESPFLGHPALVIRHELEAARGLAGELSALGLSASAARPGEAPPAPEKGWALVVIEPECAAAEEIEAWSATAVLLGIGEPDGSLAVAGWLGPSPPAARVLADYGHAREHRSLAEENASLRAALAGRLSFGNFVSRDPRMAEVIGTARAVAATRASVLLLGETGTGKSLIARGLHAESDRSEAPFVVVNCGALPPALLESELFGHVRGSFTGAVKDKVGRFEQADGGTLFLDEIDSAPLELQVKLLRVLQERTYERVGEARSRTCDVRVIAACNRDLELEIAAGRFREDLYWRLNVVQLELPPLRERPGDLALLATHFLQRFATEYQRPTPQLAPDALTALAAHDWPGNVRQLENALERAVLLTPGDVITRAELPAELRPARDPELREPHPLSLLAGLDQLETLPPLREALEGPERALLIRALELTAGSRKDAASMLGLNRSTLFNKMKKYDLMNLSFENGAA